MISIIPKKPQDFLNEIMKKKNLLVDKSFFIQLDNFPDYDLLPYINNTFNRYIFSNRYKFENVSQMVYKAKLSNFVLFDNDSIDGMCAELNINNSLENEKKLTIAYKQNQEIFNEYKFDYESWEEIEIYKYEITSIDNFSKEIKYQGAFYGHTDSIDNGYYNFYCILNIYSALNINRKIYDDLIIESYNLFIEKKYKQAYYIAYSAFENFINDQFYKSLPNEKKNLRIKDKIDKIYLNNYSNEFYHFLKQNLKNYTNKRNDIAHGNTTKSITKKEAINILNLVISIIYSYENDFLKINDL